MEILIIQNNEFYLRTPMPNDSLFDREIAQALAVLQVAIVSIDFKRFEYTDLDDKTLLRFKIGIVDSPLMHGEIAYN